MRRWLREARRARGLRQKEMAWRCGCSVSHYCNMEAGRRQKRLRLETAEKIVPIIPAAGTLCFVLAVAGKKREKDTV